MKKKNFSITVAIIASLIAFLFLVPLPYNVKCAVEIKPNNDEVKRVIVRSPGKLSSVEVDAGQRVQAGDVIAKIVDIPLQLEYEETRRQGATFDQQWLSLRQDKKRVDATVTGDIVRLERARESNVRSRKNLEERLSWLTLTAPIAGVVLPPPEKKADPNVEGRLPTWHGSLLREENRGARVEMDDIVCMVGNPDAFEAMLVIDQADLPFVQEGLDALILLDSYAGDTLPGKITDIAGSDMEVASPTLSNQTGGQMALVTDAAGVQRPQSASYEARVPLADMTVALRSGMRGRAKVKAKPQTIAVRMWRLLNRTFHFSI